MANSEQATTYPIGLAELARTEGKHPRTARRVAAAHDIGIIVGGRRIIRSAREKAALLAKIRKVPGNPNFLPGYRLGLPRKKVLGK